MALKSTVYKVELTLSDMDRQYYATHAMTLALHPSETAERMMVRVLAFALFASDTLEFSRGLSADDEPDLWQKAMTGDIERWIELGQPDEKRVRKACARAAQVVIFNWQPRAAAVWWQQNQNAFTRFDNLQVIRLDAECVEAFAALIARTMRLQCTIQDGHLWIGDDTSTVEVCMEHLTRR